MLQRWLSFCILSMYVFPRDSARTVEPTVAELGMLDLKAQWLESKRFRSQGCKKCIIIMTLRQLQWWDRNSNLWMHFQLSAQTFKTLDLTYKSKCVALTYTGLEAATVGVGKCWMPRSGRRTVVSSRNLVVKNLTLIVWQAFMIDPSFFVPPFSIGPHLFHGADHEKRRGEQLKWSLAFKLYIGSFPCAQLPGPVHTARLGRVCFFVYLV